MTRRAARVSARTLAILATLWLNQAAPVLLATAPHTPALIVVELPNSIATAAAITNLRRALR